MERCMICLADGDGWPQLCAHRALGAAKQTCGPHTICGACTLKMPRRTGQIMCPICKRSLGTWRRAYEQKGLTYEELRSVVDGICKQSKGFVLPYGEGVHILFNVQQLETHFDAIRRRLREGTPGELLKDSVRKGFITQASSNRSLWAVLVKSLKLSGVGIEHAYDMLSGIYGNFWSSYAFDEMIVLSHTLLLVPSMQHYGPLLPTLSLGGQVAKFTVPAPLLFVGMLGMRMKDNFWKDNVGEPGAEVQRELVSNPERRRKRMRSLFSALLEARGKDLPLRVDVALCGVGAIGGSAQDFLDSLQHMRFQAGDKVNVFSDLPSTSRELRLGKLGCSAELNPPGGLAGPAPRSELRVLVAGSDPFISLSVVGKVCMSKVEAIETNAAQSLPALFPDMSVQTCAQSIDKVESCAARPTKRPRWRAGLLHSAAEVEEADSTKMSEQRWFCAGGRPVAPTKRLRSKSSIPPPRPRRPRRGAGLLHSAREVEEVASTTMSEQKLSLASPLAAAYTAAAAAAVGGA